MRPEEDIPLLWPLWYNFSHYKWWNIVRAIFPACHLCGEKYKRGICHLEEDPWWGDAIDIPCPNRTYHSC
jgi:hypothetical protein